MTKAKKPPTDGPTNAGAKKPAGEDVPVGSDRLRKPQVRPADIPEAKAMFLQSLRDGWSVTRSAKKAFISREAAYSWRNEDLVFRRAWDDAYESGTDWYEDKAREGAKQLEPRLIDITLRARRPQQYRERLDITVSGGVDLKGMPDQQLNELFALKLRAKLEPLFAREERVTLDDVLNVFRITPLPPIGELIDGTAKRIG